MKIDFFRHDLNPDAAKEIGDVLGSSFITSGKICKEVEAQLCKFFGIPEALAVNSWTNGAQAAILAMDIGPGDDVIVPAMTFIASANIVEMAGARLIFADVDAESLLLTPQKAVSALTSTTRLVIPVHLYGQMCDIKGIRKALDDAGRKDVRILEDAAHCFEGRRDAYLPGQYSDAAIFSFYATKNITCGEGGAIICRDPDLAQKLRQTRLHGMSATAADRFAAGKYRHWDMTRLGVKANLPDLLAALLPRQIETIRRRLPLRQALANRYRQAFSESEIAIQKIDLNVDTADHIFPIHVPPAHRDEAIAVLNEAGISVAVNYRNVPTLTYYREKYGYSAVDFPVAEHWGSGTLTLPLYPSLTDTEQKYVISKTLELIAPMCRSRDDMKVGVRKGVL